MAHLHRFFVEPGCPDSGVVALPQAEAHHAINVARVHAGDEVALLDGVGGVRYGTFEAAGKRAANVTITRAECQPRPDPRLTLMVAWLQRDAPVEEIIRRGTDLGVDRFVFFSAMRSQRPIRDKQDKWQRVAMESCKQCGRAWLPDFEAHPSLEKALANHTGPLLACTQHDAATSLRAAIPQENTTILIGPEGDLTGEEWDTASRAGGVAVSLGTTVFRTEAAALLATTLTLASWKRYDLPVL